MTWRGRKFDIRMFVAVRSFTPLRALALQRLVRTRPQVSTSAEWVLALSGSQECDPL